MNTEEYDKLSQTPSEVKELDRNLKVLKGHCDLCFVAL